MKNDLIGKKVRITEAGSLPPYYKAGDVCVVVEIDSGGDAWGNFHNQGNATVFNLGACCIGRPGSDDFEIVEEPAPLPIADAAFYEGELDKANREIERLKALLNTPELHDFAKAVSLEAAHQRERWGTDHDAGKTPFDWVFLMGHLATRAAVNFTAGNQEKALHHAITTAAACANWHAAMSGTDTSMRPGSDPDFLKVGGTC